MRKEIKESIFAVIAVVVWEILVYIYTEICYTMWQTADDKLQNMFKTTSYDVVEHLIDQARYNYNICNTMGVIVISILSLVLTVVIYKRVFRQ